jgi:3-isopropylmalate/(R)-2-methylmalate dehydratase small subunit
VEKFTRLTGVATPIMEENINTDALMPTAWIINPGEDWGNGLFRNWRRDKKGLPLAEFALNQKRYLNSKILLAGKNFGCGSSREEAVWGLVDYGIRCVIAPSFGDIFYNSSFKNGLLPIILAEKDVFELAHALSQSETSQLTVDLETRTIIATDGSTMDFALDDSRRRPLLDGMDDISRTLSLKAQIDAFQTTDRTRRPWIYRD